MEINMVIVRICAERIVNNGLNPKTSKTYIIDDVTNTDYREAIEDYILQNTPEV
ncbi:hypothetical protein [Clostridium botulinum]|uniref:Uncharacterized protein n=1 Tax=Clostridium botulinum (strain Kyoto / Type A2) TaxID=536232 RepID=C1FR68_CLOBJ|nr:hypothetical protein [Clostridium botulinum]ACO84727.1 conserved hypothetical protein [Clostridium botulinum A2 str. Kyoto]ACO86153.1 conserved hypothetical protein [Clostridium botulinum A2 str. Kyoto]MBN3364331.1 hypothetical protein [Clostridium botulinum]MBN3368505.1 hypothetical protein [Clostridium botulinum]MBN3373955.1 hypothetical protein [Clostridium botulinum]